MAANGRAGEIRKVMEAYTDLMETSRGVVNVKIVSAEKLDKKALDTIQAAVVTMVHTYIYIHTYIQIYIYRDSYIHLQSY